MTGLLINISFLYKYPLLVPRYKFRPLSMLTALKLPRSPDDKNLLAAQFAWNYRKPRLRLGISSLQTECAIYRERGFEYLYLDQAHLYKQELEGFEILGPL